jgi:eukaryotic-like serine/threonine-protein kinase
VSDDDGELARCFMPLTGELPNDIFLGGRQAKPRPTRDFERALFDLEPELPAVGFVLDKYVLERPIGIGGFAVVFRARHTVLDTELALKIMRPSVLRRRPELWRLLEEEARGAARISHPNIVRVIDVTMGHPYSYIIMDYVHGLDLAAMLRHKGRLPQRMVLRIIEHVAAGLQAGLAQGVVHRDVKPSNILLTSAGVTKLADFGLAGGAMSKLHGIVGTLGYMSPEHINDPTAVDHRSDIFSLGMTAYRALSGISPAKHANTPQEAFAILKSTAFRPLHRLNAQISPRTSALVMAMLALQPADRPQTYSEIMVPAERIRRER